MSDIVNSETRSRWMSNIRSSNTKPERIVRQVLHKMGYRFRLNSKIGTISPDVVLRSRKIAVFVHGCYWHKHSGCKLAYADRSYSEELVYKFEANKRRDQKQIESLLKAGWRICIVWECATRSKEELSELPQQISNWIRRDEPIFETAYKK